MNVLPLLLCAALGYFLGNLQSGVLIGRAMGKGDLRAMGSGASGTTNAWRVLGKKAALLTFLCDVLKGLLAAWIGTLIAGREGGLAAGVFVVAGHIWPVLFGWRGGKGVASTLGVLALVQPAFALGYGAVLLLGVFLERRVSVGSVSGAGLLLTVNAIACIFEHDWPMLAFGVLVNGIILFAHRANIRRLLNGTEPLLQDLPFQKGRNGGPG